MPFFFPPLLAVSTLQTLATADSLDVRIPLSTLIFIPLLRKIPREIPRVSGGAREEEGGRGRGSEEREAPHRAARDGVLENPS